MPEPTATRAIRNRLQRWRFSANLVKKKKKKKKTEQCCIGKQDLERYLKQFKRSILHIAQLLKNKNWLDLQNKLQGNLGTRGFFSLVKRSFVGRMPTRLDLTETGNRAWNTSRDYEVPHSLLNTSVTQCRRRMGGPTRKSKRRLQLP